MEELISKSTKNNWNRLNTYNNNKLTIRANKRLSNKTIIPFEYFENKSNFNKIEKLLTLIKNNNWNNEDIIYSLAINLINIYNIKNQHNVEKFIEEYSNFNIIEELINYDIRDIFENDILGLVYQCILSEGDKNQMGSYYTPKKITLDMTKDLDFSDGQTFLDPCCGSGAFLLSLENVNPNQIYGIDIDKIAVMISKINLILKYRGIEFNPNIFNIDFLSEFKSDQKFSYIITNPPWGSVTNKGYIPKEIKSGESFSCFIIKSLELSKEFGILRFLLPTSILNIKLHKDIRQVLLHDYNLSKIKLYDNVFTGVTTKYLNLEIINERKKDFLTITDNYGTLIQDKSFFDFTQNSIITNFSKNSKNILMKIKKNGKFYLDNSVWALGIVTGDNKGKLSDVQFNGFEPIFTGKELNKYTLKEPKKYIKFDKNSFQQVAKEEYYRADEKLVYKFVSNKLVFAYDNNQNLFLNSANILIPNIPNMSIKTILAYLNSEVFSYYYKSLFDDIKILKGNLSEIPFPEISKETDEKISKMVDNILNNKSDCDDFLIQKEIYKSYNLTENEIKYIKENL